MEIKISIMTKPILNLKFGFKYFVQNYIMFEIIPCYPKSDNCISFICRINIHTDIVE